MAKKKQKEIKVDYVKDFMEYTKANKEQIDLETFENGLRAAEKKQKEYKAIDTSCTRLADNIKITFEFTDQEKIKESIDKVKRDLGLLQDDLFYEEFEKFTDYQVKSYHEKRKMILEERRAYDVTFSKEGISISTIGAPDLRKLAEYMAKQIKEAGLQGLSADTATSLIFHKLLK